MSIVAFIPARGGSKSIPLKNIKPIAGKPLIFWTIEAALKTPIIEKIFVSTDSKKIKQCIEKEYKQGVVVIPRSKETATDTASSELPLLEFCKNHVFNHVFFIQATSPLLKSNDLLHAWTIFSEKKYDSLLSVVRQKRFIWSKEGNATPQNYSFRNRPRRQDFDGFLVENGAFYLSSRDAILSSKCRISGKIGLYEMPQKTYFEIDEPDDWNIVEGFLENIKNLKTGDKRL